jgi:hypothetical protein
VAVTSPGLIVSGRRVVLLAAISSVIIPVLAGCGSSDSGAPKTRAIAPVQARAIPLTSTRADVLRTFGPPAHLGSPYSTRRGRSCLFYRLNVRNTDPSTRVEWRFCFRKGRIASSGTYEYDPRAPQQRVKPCPGIEKVKPGHSIKC